MTPIRTLLPAAALAMAAFTGAYAADMPAAPAMAHDGVLTDAKGMTLYTFDQDPADASKSTCNGPCATNWPPLAADAKAAPMGEWAVVARDDGSKQWAYKGKPLYRWAKDQKPGDRTGDGVKGVWHAARP
jgi:predicted lipoprotein with Yx(FWY)xxD motif